LDIVANNVANADTTGFKQTRVLLDTYTTQSKGQPQPMDRINFVVDRATYHDLAQGPILKTGNELDVAISGEGYFSIQAPEGVRYTRGGAFQVNDQGELVNASGYQVLGDGDAAISIPPDATEINIAQDGTISTQNGTVGKLSVVSFENASALEEAGQGLYKSNSAATPVESGVRIAQGMLEKSNVQPVLEIAQMMEIVRNYAQTQRMLDQEHERIRNAIAKLGRVA
jgi:flagellar basal-body rod protein FlgF